MNDYHEYFFEGHKIRLSDDDLNQFNNNLPETRVNIGNPTVFSLKDGRKVVGKPYIENIDFIRPLDGCDIPLQSKFRIVQEDGKEIILKFTEIQSHNPAPFKRSH